MSSETLKVRGYSTEAQLRRRWGGMSHATFWRLRQSRPDFPKPIRFGSRKVLCDNDEAEAFEQTLRGERDQ